MSYYVYSIVPPGVKGSTELSRSNKAIVHCTMSSLTKLNFRPLYVILFNFRQLGIGIVHNSFIEDVVIGESLFPVQVSAILVCPNIIKFDKVQRLVLIKKNMEQSVFIVIVNSWYHCRAK